ncbi:hypothetical protein D3C87_1778140 [compost metagenome]
MRRMIVNCAIIFISCWLTSRPDHRPLVNDVVRSRASCEYSHGSVSGVLDVLCLNPWRGRDEVVCLCWRGASWDLESV